MVIIPSLGSKNCLVALAKVRVNFISCGSHLLEMLVWWQNTIMCPIRQTIASFTQCSTGAPSLKHNNYAVYLHHKDTAEIQLKKRRG